MFTLKGNMARPLVGMEFNPKHSSDFSEKDAFAVEFSAISHREQKPPSKSCSESCYRHLSPRTLTHHSHFELPKQGVYNFLWNLISSCLLIRGNYFLTTSIKL